MQPRRPGRAGAALLAAVASGLVAGCVPVSTSTPSTPTAAPTGPWPRGDEAPVVLSGPVVHVVDGDTLDVGPNVRVRIAIVDTPEVFGTPEACGREATAFTARFVDGREVLVVRPRNAPAQDRNGRVLGEVVRADDGASLNVALVTAGLARVDERFTDEDPDLAARVRAAAATATPASCAG